MKKCLPLLLVLIGLTLACETHAQFGKLKEKIKQKVDQRVDEKENEAIDKSLDKVEGSVDGKGDGATADKKQDSDVPEAKASEKETTLKTYSKFDFVPGDKILYLEDFSQDEVGQFPLKWNTNGSGDIVTIDGVPGKWLDVNESTKYQSPFKTKLPENYTIEFDALFQFKDNQSVPWVYVNISGSPLPGHALGPVATLTLGPNHGNSAANDMVAFESFNKDGDRLLKATDKNHNVFHNSNGKKKPVHVAIWVQKTRYRAWLNQEKVYDLPQAIDPQAVLNAFGLEITNYGGTRENYRFLISNFKIAAALPDTRSKLITEGKWSTTGILFDVNSDKINPSSYAVLKEIAGTLSENPDVKVKIIGHTDSDGDDAKNLDLSKRRAAAVKNALSSEFGIEAERMQTDGMGETKPVGDNKSAEGKAQNRRVEFIKI